MIKFNELRITNDGKNLIICAQVREEEYYENVYIKNIKIDTQDTYSEGAPSQNAITVWDDTENLNQKKVILSLVKNEIFGNKSIPDLTKNLFFVYVTAKGIPGAETPCGCDKETTLGVTLYLGDFYNTFMKYIKEMGNGNCSIPQGFIDQLLRFKAMNVSMDSGHYIQGIEYYNKWFSGKNTITYSTSNCGCNG